MTLMAAAGARDFHVEDLDGCILCFSETAQAPTA